MNSDRIPPDPSDPDQTETLRPEGTTQSQDPHAARGSSRPAAVGPYRILDVLGEGGMGIVYRAEQTKPVRRQVALKIIKLGMESKAVVARFEAERQALAIMDHPGVARVFDGGVTEQGRPYFAMELVQGEPITDHCNRQRLTIDERIELLIQVCDAVQHAHAKGVIHRDLKPSNILIEYQDGAATPKVIDFGVAKALSQKLTERTLFTEQGQLIGTPEYMSPEQAEMGAADIDTRSDIYSLGVILYELLTNARPFETETLRECGLAEIQRIIREVEPPKPSTRLSTLLSASGDPDTATRVAESRRTELGSLRKTLKRDLDWVVMRCLEKDRGRRYETANALGMELRRYLDDEPVLAGPPSATYRAGKFIKRNRGFVIGATAVIASLLLGMAGAGWGMVRAGQQREAAILARDAEALQRQAAEAATLEAQAARNAEAMQRELAVEREQEATEARAEAESAAYVANLNAAAIALQDNDSVAVRNALAKAPESLRGWEWDYLNNNADVSLSTLTKPFDTSGLALAFSPDASLLAIYHYNEDRLVKVVNARTGENIVDPFDFYQVWDLRLFLSPDNAYLAIGFESTRGLSMYRLSDGVQILPRTRSHIAFVAFHPTDDVFAMQARSGDIEVYALADFPPDKSEPIDPLQTYSIAESLQQRSGAAADSGAFSPDGRFLAVGFDLDDPGADGAVVIDTETKEVINIASHAIPTAGRVVPRFSPDGSLLLLQYNTTLSSHVDLYDTSEWRMIRRIDPMRISGQAAWVGDASFAEIDDALVLLLVDGRGLLSVIDPRSGDTLAEHRGCSASGIAAFDERRQEIVTAHDTGQLRGWNASDRLPKRSRTNIGALAVSPLDGSIVYRSRNGLTDELDGETAILWDPRSATRLGAVRAAAHHGRYALGAKDFAYSPDGMRLAVAQSNNWHTGRLQIIDTLTGRTLFSDEAMNDITGVSWSDDGELIATCFDGWDDPDSVSIRVYDGQSYELLREFGDPSKDEYFAEFQPGTHKLVATDGPFRAQVWDADTGDLLHVLQERGPSFHAIAFPPSRPDWVMLGNWSGRCYSYDLTTGERVHAISAHAQKVRAIAFSPDGDRMATSSDDRDLKLWNLKNLDSEVFNLRLPRVADSLAYSVDGETLYVGLGDELMMLDARTLDVRRQERTESRALMASIEPDARRAVAESQAPEDLHRYLDEHFPEPGLRRQAARRSIRKTVDDKALASFSADRAWPHIRDFYKARSRDLGGDWWTAQMIETNAGMKAWLESQGIGWIEAESFAEIGRCLRWPQRFREDWGYGSVFILAVVMDIVIDTKSKRHELEWCRDVMAAADEDLTGQLEPIRTAHAAALVRLEEFDKALELFQERETADGDWYSRPNDKQMHAAFKAIALDAVGRRDDAMSELRAVQGIENKTGQYHTEQQEPLFAEIEDRFGIDIRPVLPEHATTE